MVREGWVVNDPTARTLRLLSLLQTHKFWPGTELSERLEVSARTLRRDIDRLRELGYSVDATPGVAGGYRLAAGAHMPPLVLDDDEAIALAVGLRAAAGAAIAGIEDTALQALAKLEAVLPDRLRRRVNAMHSNTAVLRWSTADAVVDPEALGTLAQACRDGEEVRFDYVRKDGEGSARLVRPHQLVSVGRRWYLVAFDVRRDDWRTFRLDRMETPRLAGVRFEPQQLPDGLDAAEFVGRSIRQSPMAHEADVVVTATPEAVADVARWLDTEVEEMDGGRCRLHLRSDTLGWLLTQVTSLAINFDVTIDGDDDLAELVATTAGRLTNSDPDSRTRS